MKANLDHMNIHRKSSSKQGLSLYDKVKIVWGRVNNDNMEWLGRSIVVESAIPLIFIEVSERLLNARKRISELREWGSLMVLIT